MTERMCTIKGCYCQDPRGSMAPWKRAAENSPAEIPVVLNTTRPKFPLDNPKVLEIENRMAAE